MADAGANLVSRIELFSNDTLVGTDSSSPYSFVLNNLKFGSKTLKAIVFDDKGNKASHSVNIFIYNPELRNTVPWIEDFTLSDETTIDEGLTSWTSSRSEGKFLVQNNSFIVNGAGNAGILKTSAIDISKGPVDISLELWSQESLESDDFVKLYKIVDNGPQTLIGSKVGNQETKTNILGTASGKSLILIVEAKVSYSGEYYFMDNLAVTYSKVSGTQNERLAPPVKLYPNPASKAVTVSAPEEYSFSLTNLSGLELMSRTGLFGLNEIDVTGLSRGLYFVKIATTNSQMVKKLIKD